MVINNPRKNMICVKCKEDLAESMFYKDKHKPSGFKPRCKPCDKLSVDVDRRRKYETEYWSDPIRAKKRKQQIKKSMEKNKDHHKKIRSEYLKTENGINTQRKSRQVTRCKSKGVYVESVDPLELYKQQDGICYLCYEKFTFKEMEMDHVIPVSKGGKHELNNVKMCCGKCNKIKGSKILPEVTYQVVQTSK